MDLESLESYFDKISDQVIEEDEVVTYKSLSRKFGLHVNTSKQLLYSYLTQQKSKKCFPISATYLIAGKLSDGSFNIKIVNDVDLKNIYSSFLEITSEHVYSVHKGKEHKHVNMLNSVFEEEKRPCSVISCVKCVFKSKASKVFEEATKDDKNNVIKSAFLQSDKTLTETKMKSAVTEKKSPIKKTSPKKSKEVKKPEGGLAHLFAKAAKINTDKVTKKPDEKNNAEEAVCPDIKENKEEKETSVTKSALQGSKKKKGSRGNKRRRIQTLSDSDESQSNDDEKFNVEEKTSSFCCSAEEKSEDSHFIVHNKRKKRKVIDTTVMNEDGYLETKKQVVFETDSENEPEKIEEPSAKKEKQPKLEKPLKHQVGNSKKQSSLLNFFKKT